MYKDEIKNLRQAIPGNCCIGMHISVSQWSENTSVNGEVMCVAGLRKCKQITHIQNIPIIVAL